MTQPPSDMSLRVDRQRYQRAMTTTLMTAYLQSKALDSQLQLLMQNKMESGFTFVERVAIAEARKAMATVFTELNKVICDTGNELGLEHFKAIYEVQDGMPK